MARPTLAILDDFLDEDARVALWTEFQFAELHPVSRTVGAWKLDDGVPLGGHEILTPPRDEELIHDPTRPQRYPSNTAIDAVITTLLSDPGSYESVVSDAWESISARAYVYPHGTGLSWHRDDSELYAGAFIYYVHPHWNAHWGGELLIADETDDDLDIMAYRFENEPYSERLLEQGAGRFVMPKPNRLVILGGEPHAVAPVSAAAGQNVRASVSGFFLKEAR
jgi:hypothetical protein